MLNLDQSLQSVWQRGQINPWLRKALLVIGGSLLIALSAQITVPLQPVPVTLQTLAILFIGMTYGWRLGFATVMLYLIEGALGLPVFAEGYAGLQVLLGTNGGYLVGLVPAICICGFLAERGWGSNFIGVILAAFLGTLAIYAAGLPILASFIGYSAAIKLGLLPFVLGDSLKIIFLAFVVPAFWKK